MTPDIVVNFVQAIWPLYTNGDQVDVEVLPRAKTCPVSGMVMWNRDAGRWVVLLDNALVEPRSLLVLLGHELGHVVHGHLGKAGNASTVTTNRAVFVGEVSLAAQQEHSRWQAEGQKAETRREENEVNEFAARFVRDWLPLLETFDNLGQLIVGAITEKLEV